VFFIGMATAWIWFIGIMWEKSRLDLYGVPGYFVSVDVSSVTQGFYSAWSAAGLATGAQTALTWILGKIMRRNLFRAMLYWSGLLLFTYFAAFVGPRFSTPDTFLVSASDPSWVVVGRSADNLIEVQYDEAPLRLTTSVRVRPAAAEGKLVWRRLGHIENFRQRY
jgi:hypothetical protein